MEKLPKNWLALDIGEVQRVADLCPPGTYRDVPQADLPSFVPPSMREKCIGGTVMASGIHDQGCVFVLNLKRSDKGKLDENPLIWVQSSGSPQASGYMYQHGTWNGRTTPLSPEIASLIQASGVAAASVSAASGSLADLLGSSDLGAFEAAAARVLRNPE